MTKVYMPADFNQSHLFGSPVQTDEGGKFLMLPEFVVSKAVKLGGTVAPAPVAPVVAAADNAAPVVLAPAAPLTPAPESALDAAEKSAESALAGLEKAAEGATK